MGVFALLRRVALIALLAALFPVGLVAAPAGASPPTSSLYVSPSASTNAPDKSCGTAGYATITDAVNAAADGARVVVCPGTYTESVTVTGKAVHLVGRAATIDANGLPEGLAILGPDTVGSSVEGFRFENAEREGLYADGTSHLSIVHNRFESNDQACQPQTTEDDCGEALHLDAVTYSVIAGNALIHNTGGILLTDGVPPGSTGEFAFGFTTQYSGPAAHNVISHNIAIDNVWDCGITLPSHNSNAVATSGPNAGQPQPSEGGVYDNLVADNIADGNGTASGAGAGILAATPFPGTGAYDNTITGNHVAGNALAGITVHSHTPLQDVSGTSITGNVVGTNALDGNNGNPGDSDFDVSGTIGILVASASVSVTGTEITGNVIQNNDTGIWTLNTSGDFTQNHFAHDTVEVSQN